MDGVLVIDKPSGPTSHDVVAHVRRALKLRRIGHTGTLDPLATGVLPLVIGRATRLAQFLSAATKSYEATVRLGVATDTFDILGQVTARRPLPEGAIDRERVERALARFRGSYLQVPPAFSAKKVGGIRSYDRARQSAVVALDPVPVTVESLELVGLDGDALHLRITATAGFYVRSLAHAIGEALDVGGCLAALRRTRSGDFGLADAVALDSLARDPSTADARLIGLDSLLPSMPAVTVTADGVRRALNGAVIRAIDRAAGELPMPDGLIRLCDEAGRLRAVARRTGSTDVLHPLVVLG